MCQMLLCSHADRLCRLLGGGAASKLVCSGRHIACHHTLSRPRRLAEVLWPRAAKCSTGGRGIFTAAFRRARRRRLVTTGCKLTEALKMSSGPHILSTAADHAHTHTGTVTSLGERGTRPDGTWYRTHDRTNRRPGKLCRQGAGPAGLDPVAVVRRRQGRRLPAA